VVTCGVWSEMAVGDRRGFEIGEEEEIMTPDLGVLFFRSHQPTRHA
jgi:hypothetical protein